MKPEDNNIYLCDIVLASTIRGKKGVTKSYKQVVISDNTSDASIIKGCIKIKGKPTTDAQIANWRVLAIGEKQFLSESNVKLKKQS